MNEETILEDFLFENTTTQASTNDKQAKKRIRRNYYRKTVFNNASEAESYMKEKQWKKLTKTTTDEGDKVFYRCGLGKYRKNECPKMSYLLYQSQDEKVKIAYTSNVYN